MPYISNHNQRAKLDEIVEELGKVLKIDGDLNYLLYAYCKRHIKPSYNTYKNFLGEISEVQAEIRRRLLAPYETSKIRENGDVE